MSPEQYVDALYSLVLGRPADKAGRAAWSDALRASGDATIVLRGLLDSEEGRRRAAQPPDCSSLVRQALAGLGRRPRVVDVGAQSLGEGTDAWAPLMAYGPVDLVGFDPLAERLQGHSGAGGDTLLLPYAIADGGVHVLHVNNDDATSSLIPLDMTHNAAFEHLATLRTVRTQPVQTHRLDEVLPDGPVDLLKLDVQGAELLVLQGAPITLARTAVAHVEVEFGPIYRGQPLYQDVAVELAKPGFYLVDLLVSHRYAWLVPSGTHSPDRLLWADAVFVREGGDPAAQALIAAAVYRKPTWAEYLLAEAGLSCPK